MGMYDVSYDPVLIRIPVVGIILVLLISYILWWCETKDLTEKNLFHFLYDEDIVFQSVYQGSESGMFVTASIPLLIHASLYFSSVLVLTFLTSESDFF